jgi:DNA-dependent RNA polymerase auxiliary subunit epsilon
MKGKKKPVVGIDINACYWNTAHKLGYISDALFERGLDTCKKQGLLIAIGCLNKKPVLKNYKEGKLVGYSFDEQVHSRYAPFYWNIIEHTHQIMMESYERFKDNWYMYLTDCLFVDLDVAKDAHKFISDKGYKCKSHQIEFINFDGKRLRWFDFKENRDKEIHAQGRDIYLTYTLSKIGKGMHYTPPSL